MNLPIAARRVFRLSLTIALSLAAAYALAIPLPYIAPIFALMLALQPKPPLGLKHTIAVLVLITVTTGSGLLITPILMHYPMTGLMIVFLGLIVANHLTVNMAKGAVGALLTMGLTLVTAAGTMSYQVAQMVIFALTLAIAIAIGCHHLAYLFFPEDPMPAAVKKKAAKKTDHQSNWIALRATFVVFPAYLLALTNPSQFLPIIMKSVSLGQQGSVSNAREAGKELLGSTFLAGIFAALFWILLSIHPNLWMFFLWMLAFGFFFACKLYGITKSRFKAPFWINTVITLFILLGPAVQDSATGKDVKTAFLVRFSLFVAVTLYAITAISVFEYLRKREKRSAIA